ncbi:MAG: epoxide hydrolase [Rhizobacter sp.]|nr:epoxide hydrolase [Ferruginibacter sp.]
MLSGALAMQGTIADAQGPSNKEVISAEAIRPFTVRIPDKEIKDLRRRIMETRWPDMETVADASQGAKLSNLKGLANYWGKNYDWRKAEAKLNAYPQFMTMIDGVDIHFIHVRSKEPNAMPLIISHGWPGSIIELLKIIDPLTNPKAYGGKAEDAFDVVIPSLPGFGFSGKPTEAGWELDRIAKAWAVLMNRIGYKHYVAQGGDWGAGIVNSMGLQAPAGLLGIHSNLPATLPNEAGMALGTGVAPEGFSAQELAAFNHLSKSIREGGFTYKTTMTTRPQAVGYGLNDSPTGLAAWLFLHPGFANWSYGADPKQSPTMDDVLDNISLYWFTNTATSSARIYWENRNTEIVSAGAQKSNLIKLPVAITVFPEDVYTSPESWARRAYPNLIYFHIVDKGGHFAAWEQPQLFTEEMRAAFKSLR